MTIFININTTLSTWESFLWNILIAHVSNCELSNYIDITIQYRSSALFTTLSYTSIYCTLSSPKLSHLFNTLIHIIKFITINDRVFFFSLIYFFYCPLFCFWTIVSLKTNVLIYIVNHIVVTINYRPSFISLDIFLNSFLIYQ